MIDPKELRIGNYVRSIKNNSNLCFGGNLPFWEVTIDDMLHILNNPNNYEPIPLTEDWLLKFGWVWNEEATSFEKYPNGDARMHLSKSFFGFDMFNYVLKAVIRKDIRYVHQLQNLIYVISGQELIYNENHK